MLKRMYKIVIITGHFVLRKLGCVPIELEIEYKRLTQGMH